MADPRSCQVAYLLITFARLLTGANPPTMASKLVVAAIVAKNVKGSQIMGIQVGIGNASRRREITQIGVDITKILSLPTLSPIYPKKGAERPETHLKPSIMPFTVATPTNIPMKNQPSPNLMNMNSPRVDTNTPFMTK